ncbi:MULTISPECIES: ABC transporter substrate-binding protein [unclassified Sporosarcina]|uniref:ABC transporter substrate-binding protein n=1 Tax=unclassified Sporosarcina TaxID=2647733 RepID=UPI001303F9D8|nr:MULTISPECIES: ABC transporter substrate-binding protein [unclassified Sporosarcina]
MKKIRMFMLIAVIALLSACNEETSSSESAAKDSGSTDKPIDITFAEPARILSFAPLYIAIEEGYFKDQGINAEISSGGGGSQVIATLLSGDSQFAINAPRAMFSALDSGEDLIAIQSLNSALTYEVALSNKYLESKKIDFNSPLEKKLGALEGATIGIDQIGDSSDVYLRYLMEKYNFDQSKMKAVKLTGSGPKIGGMQENIIDGGVQSPPFTALAEDNGAGKLALRLSEEEDYADLVWEVVFAKKEYIDNNPEIAKKVVKALGQGIELARDNPEKAAATITSYFDGIDEEMILTSLKGLQATYVGNGEMTKSGWDNAQKPLVEFSDISGVSSEHDTTEDVLWTNKYIKEAFSE